MQLTAAPLVELDLTSLPGSAGVARDRMTAVLCPLVDDDVVDRVVLLVSELVTNAVTHARTPVLLRAWVTEDLVRVEVHDCALPSRRLERCATLGAGRGCGLRLVDTLATSWGVRDEYPGKCVWFEVRFAAGDAYLGGPATSPR